MDQIKRLGNEEDKAVAYSLAEALIQEDVEKFLQLYDEIPASVSPQRLGNIKEMARQVAALPRTYRCGPIPGKDSYFGINHSLPTSQLSLNGSLGSTDFSAFKTPPEGCTPVDSKQFDYEEETLKTLEAACNLSLTALYDGNKQHESDKVSQKENIEACPLDTERNLKSNDADITKAEDDAFHTPPEFQDDHIAAPPFGYPPSSDQLITSVINLLSTTTTSNRAEDTKDGDTKDEQDDTTSGKELEKTDVVVEEMLTSSQTEKVNSEKDSLEGSPSRPSSFAQEEDDSGISTVDENDVSRDSPTTLNDSGSSDGKVPEAEKPRKRNTHSLDYVQRPASSTSEKRTSPSQAESKYLKSNSHDTEDGIGWQTRYKRIGRKRNETEYERRLNYNNSEVSGQNERSHGRDYTHMGTREGRSRDKNTRMENYSKTRERSSEDYVKVNRGHNAWNSRNNEDNEIGELISVPTSRRFGRRGQGPLPYGGKKSEGRWAKNSSRDKYGEEEERNKDEHALEDMSTVTQSSVFSYRDALLKVGAKGTAVPNSKETIQPLLTPKTDRKAEFDLHSAASYLLSAWTSVNRLHRKDPSKVYIYSDD